MIYADQTLHGYANGHQLLKASCEFKLNDRKKMDELSDLNGMTDEKSFSEYYTGYPIEDGKKYVIAKTWYASEMKRAGCVWTHSIIFNTQDIEKISDIRVLLNTFKRPQNSLNWNYMEKVSIETEDISKQLNYNRQKLEYVIYTIFGSAKPKCVVVPANGFINELFMVLFTMPCGLLEKFTFCTMSYANRSWESIPFQYQMVCETNKFFFINISKDVHICEDIDKIKKYPYWVSCYADHILDFPLDKMSNYINQYGETYMSLNYYNCFLRLYFAMNSKHMSLEEYCDAIEIVASRWKEDLWQKTVDLILEDKFYIQYFEKHEYEILEMIDMKKFRLTLKQKKKMEEKVIVSSPEKLYPILKKYICGQLKENAREEVEQIIKKLKPDDLRSVSNMDENICIVLIRMNGKMLLSKAIWKQPKDFQRALIYSCDKNISDDLLNKLLAMIVCYDSENISEDLYDVFGERIIKSYYTVIEGKTDLDEKKSEEWFNVLLKNQVLLINNVMKIPYKNHRLYLFLHLNMNTKNSLRAIDKQVWDCIYADLFLKERNEEMRVKLALKFFPIIFEADNRFSDDFVQNIVGTVYRELKNNTLSFDQWKQIEYLLPEVELCYSWDKCLRVRKALEEKEYSVSSCLPCE